jgi:hypothetical protein
MSEKYGTDNGLNETDTEHCPMADLLNTQNGRASTNISRQTLHHANRDEG